MSECDREREILRLGILSRILFWLSGLLVGMSLSAALHRLGVLP